MEDRKLDMEHINGHGKEVRNRDISNWRGSIVCLGYTYEISKLGWSGLHAKAVYQTVHGSLTGVTSCTVSRQYRARQVRNRDVVLVVYISTCFVNQTYASANYSGCFAFHKSRWIDGWRCCETTIEISFRKLSRPRFGSIRFWLFAVKVRPLEIAPSGAVETGREWSGTPISENRH